MSDSSPDISELITEASEFLFSNCLIISGTALVFYEYAITFSSEVTEVWNSRFNGAQALFFLTRYPFMLYTALLCAANLTLNPSEMFCQVTTIGADASYILPVIGLYGIFTLRTYAIYQKNPLILVTLGMCGVASTAVGIYGDTLATTQVYSFVLGGGCGQNFQPIFPRIRLVSTILSLVIDILVFTLTFAKTIRHAMEMRKVGLGNSLGYFILRDGAMYFLAKLLMGVVTTVVFFVPASTVAIGNWLTVLVSLTIPLTVILINRLVLNLRQASHIQEGKMLTIGEIGTIQEPAFAANSILGNLGAPLRVGPEDEDEMEETGVNADAEFAIEREIVDHSEIIEEPRYSSDV